MLSKPSAATTFIASLSMTSWPRRSSSSSTLGLTATRSLRPPVKMSTVSSSLRPRKTPKPAGGWASRSTSSFRATIWSRASWSVSTSRSFWVVTAARLACRSAIRSSSTRLLPRAIGEAPAQGVDLVLQGADLRIQVAPGRG